MKRFIFCAAIVAAFACPAPARAALPVGTPAPEICFGMPGYSVGDIAPAPLAGVYHPQRLQVISACAFVTGTVAERRIESDGDAHVLLALDTEYAGAINSKNAQYEHGDLVVEIIPADQAQVAIPPLGAHVEVVGPYVKDLDHGWMEIHPARYIIPARDWSGECTPPNSAAAQSGSC